MMTSVTRLWDAHFAPRVGGWVEVSLPRRRRNDRPLNVPLK